MYLEFKNTKIKEELFIKQCEVTQMKKCMFSKCIPTYMQYTSF